MTRYMSIKLRVYKDIHTPDVKLTKYAKGAYVSGIKVFNHLPQSIKMLMKRNALNLN
jgi:hypothetical protein